MRDTPTFVATFKDGAIVFAFRPQFDAYVRAHFVDQDQLEVQVRKRKEKRSDRQNRAMWALLNNWALQRGHNVNDLKDDVMGEVFGWNDKPSPLSHRILPREMRTSMLSVEEFCTLIDGILQLAAEDGVVLDAPDEYRIAKEAGDVAMGQMAQFRS